MPGNPRNSVIEKALKDPAFKAALLKDPKSAVEKATGVKVPAGVTLKVLEDSASVVHLILPADAAKGTLSEEDLSKVAGGASGVYTKPGYCYNNCTDSPTSCMIPPKF